MFILPVFLWNVHWRTHLPLCPSQFWKFLGLLPRRYMKKTVPKDNTSPPVLILTATKKILITDLFSSSFNKPNSCICSKFNNIVWLPTFYFSQRASCRCQVADRGRFSFLFWKSAAQWTPVPGHRQSYWKMAQSLTVNFEMFLKWRPAWELYFFKCC